METDTEIGTEGIERLIYSDESVRDNTLRHWPKKYKSISEIEYALEDADNDFSNENYIQAIPKYHDILRFLNDNAARFRNFLDSKLNQDRRGGYSSKDYDSKIAKLLMHLGIAYLVRADIPLAISKLELSLHYSGLNDILANFDPRMRMPHNGKNPQNSSFEGIACAASREQSRALNQLYNDFHARFWLSKACLLDGETDDAAKALEPLIENGTLLHIINRRGDISSEPALRRINSQSINLADAYSLFAEIMLKKGERKKSLEYCKRTLDYMVENRISDNHLLLNIGSVYYEAGDILKARKLFSRIIMWSFARNRDLSESFDYFSCARNRVSQIKRSYLPFISNQYIFREGSRESLWKQFRRLDRIHRKASKRTTIPLGIFTYKRTENGKEEQKTVMVIKMSPGFTIFDRMKYSDAAEQRRMLESAFDVAAEIRSGFGSRGLEKPAKDYYSRKIESVLLDTLNPPERLREKIMGCLKEFDHILGKSADHLGLELYIDNNLRNLTSIGAHTEKFDFESDLGLPCVIDMASAAAFERAGYIADEDMLEDLIHLSARKRAMAGSLKDPEGFIDHANNIIGFAMIYKHLSMAGYRLRDMKDSKDKLPYSFPCYAFSHLYSAAEIARGVFSSFSAMIEELISFAGSVADRMDLAKKSSHKESVIRKILGNAQMMTEEKGEKSRLMYR